MKLTDRMDASLIPHVLGAMTVGMKGEMFASIVLSDLGCAVENANAASANSKHVDLRVTRNNKLLSVQVKSTAIGSKDSFFTVTDSLVEDGNVEWFCIPTLDNEANELKSMFFVEVAKLKPLGRRYPSNPKGYEVSHSAVSKLEGMIPEAWVSRIFGDGLASRAHQHSVLNLPEYHAICSNEGAIDVQVKFEDSECSVPNRKMSSKDISELISQNGKGLNKQMTFDDWPFAIHKYEIDPVKNQLTIFAKKLR